MLSERMVGVALVVGTVACLAMLMLGWNYGSKAADCAMYDLFGPRHHWQLTVAGWALVVGAAGLVAVWVGLMVEWIDAYVAFPVIPSWLAALIGGGIGWKMIAGFGWTC